MKKIMFNDKYGLTQAVLEGRKTMTRRLINLCENDLEFMKISDQGEFLFCSKTVLDGAFPKYKIGEKVAIAQSYHSLNKSGYLAPEWLDHTCEDSAGYENKMFVRADLMPHGISITDIKAERLQDISDEDCLKEGVKKHGKGTFKVDGIRYALTKRPRIFYTPKQAFECLIDKICGKGTWERNPFVFAYEFELIK